MTVHDIFTQIIGHQIEGLMFHDQMADYYGFLGLTGYRKDHEYRYKEESHSYRKISRYYEDHYHKLPVQGEIKNPNVIPQAWYGVLREQVDTNTVRTAVKNGLEKWISWEKDTKDLYERLYVELLNIQEIAAAVVVQELIKDVANELRNAQWYYQCKKYNDFSIDDILEEQR